MHGERWKNHGTTEATWQTTVEGRFWAKVDRSGGPDACWPWIGHVKNNGYGVFWRAERDRPYAHRLAFTISHGAIAAGLDVDHQCHNRDGGCYGGNACPHRRCCNPAHLRSATRSVNLRAGRGRRRRPGI